MFAENFKTNSNSMVKHLLLAFCILLTAASCTKEQLNLIGNIKTDTDHEVAGRWMPRQSGVVLTFDDKSVDEWYALNQIIAPELKWKATFYVTRFASLNSDRISKLRNLQTAGHEIAGHGWNHLDAVKYIKEYGVESYINTEITPMLNLMRRSGLKVVNFAYPFGSRNSTTDSLLLNYFISLRGTTYSNKVTDVKNLNCYYGFDRNRVVYGLGIDTIYNNSLSYIKSVLQYAKENRKIVILYAHKPVPVAAPGEYQTGYATLQEICRYVKSNGMRFYNMRDLYSIR
mgnify:CR=1 FL=1